MPSVIKNNKGRGKDIPPDIFHVKIWFSQNNSSEKMAVDFYKFYQRIKWRGKKGKKIRDWKMYAWHWIWK
ncbi:MAG: hypothetical protein LBF27_13910 [Sphingobacterium sp.]|jgi:hypothetical protein|nr:hypothetical protein [Sphingobacterium sp.]